MFTTPAAHYFRLHHPRPRFKSNEEAVLHFVAQTLADLGELPSDQFAAEANRGIRQFPGNAHLQEKTINNWRTEISALFSLYRDDGQWTRPTLSATRLATNQDLIEFFRHFLITFQYPGGHLKPQESAKMIAARIQFHPAKFLIELLQEGQRNINKEGRFGVTPAEVTHIVFNDLRVTARSSKTPTDCAIEIIRNRKSGVEYDSQGDVTRYARDVLDYLRLADIVSYRPATNSYSLNPNSLEIALAIVANAETFDGYQHLYGRLPSSREVAECQLDWTDFVNKLRSSAILAGDIVKMLRLSSAHSDNDEDLALLAGIERALNGTANDIGRIGEALVIAHERNRLKALGRTDLISEVKKIPESYAAGYDIRSFDGKKLDGFEIDRRIEVKTTRTRSRQLMLSFKMTPNEWSVARGSRDSYFVYRIFLTPEGASLFVINDPYGQEVRGAIRMEPRDGAEIVYEETAGEWHELKAIGF
jgi:hypothetical protein